MNSRDGKTWWWAILAGALALRLAALGRESLWLDEAYSWWISTGTWAKAAGGEPTNPPLYYLMLHLWVQVFGTTEAALRSLSVVGSMGSVYLVYRLGLELFNAPVARLAAAYQAVSTFQIYYAQEVRCFSWQTFWVLLASWALLRAWRSPGWGYSWMALYAVAGIAGLYTHFITIFFLGGHGLLAVYWWARQRLEFRKLLAHAGAGVAIVLTFLPWLMAMLQASGGGGQKRRYLLLKLPQTYFSFLFGDTLIPLDEAAVRNIAGTLAENGVVLMLVAIVALGTALALVLAWRRSPVQGWELTLWLGATPVLLAFAVSFRVMVFDERYVQGGAPFVYLLVAAALVELSGWRRALWAGYGALLAISLWNYYFSTDRYGKEQWREVTQLVESQAAPATDLMLFEESYVHYPYDYYQRKNLKYWKLFGDLKTGLLTRKPEVIGELNQSRRVWFVRAHETNDEILNVLRQQLHLRRNTKFPKAHGIEVFEFEQKENAR